jgi:CheY-like chemotaxis protein
MHIGGRGTSHRSKQWEGVMEPRNQDGLARAGQRSDCRTPTAEHRRVLLVGPDEAWRLLTTYLFEEAGYTVYAAADHRQAVAFTRRLLPDVVIVATHTPDTLEILVQLSAESGTQDIPLVVLTTALHSPAARRMRDAGGVTLLPHAAEVDVLVGEVDALVEAAPHARRTLKRRLLDIQELARFYPPDQGGRARLRALIDRLQVAIFAVDAHGQCIAASQGVMELTGDPQRRWLTRSPSDAAAVSGGAAKKAVPWRNLVAPHAGKTTITTDSGERVAVHVALLADVLPGVQVIAMAMI